MARSCTRQSTRSFCSTRPICIRLVKISKVKPCAANAETQPSQVELNTPKESPDDLRPSTASLSQILLGLNGAVALKEDTRTEIEGLCYKVDSRPFLCPSLRPE
ncbi:hypothetical protein LTR64_005504 [Lithohypha guttulata]|uniref:uncharacterized protein n=1 Tax=Lithohypha guttulata TaxID=1690604 RepID=UPI00315DD736